MASKLVILHIDGVSAGMLERAVDDGVMPFVRRLMESEGYAVHRYRCGVPSTTPFAQAGILYGDNSEIPSFRWWDRERKVLVRFGARSTFKKVADRYFHNCRPLTEGGACIAACYPGGAADDFGIAYQERSYYRSRGSRSAWHVLGPYLANPIHLGDWVWQTFVVVGRTARDVFNARAAGRRPARGYVITDVVEEIFVHHLTRYAVQKAMREGYSPIYAAFYAFDETAHAFGPGDPSATRILRQVDRSIERVASTRADQYELVLLSDHGQVDSVPFAGGTRSPIGQLVAGMLPGVQVQVTASGGLAHIYLADQPRRLDLDEVRRLQPTLADDLSALPEIALVMAREGRRDVFLKDRQEVRGGDLEALLARYDDPGILLEQLSRLNSFEACGDVVLFGAFRDGKQVNFENQAGGHGSIGGEQLHPFVLAKKEWAIDTSQVRGAHQLHPVLRALRDRLLQGSLRSGPPQVSGLHDDHGDEHQRTSDHLQH